MNFDLEGSSLFQAVSVYNIPENHDFDKGKIRLFCSIGFEKVLVGLVKILILQSPSYGIIAWGLRQMGRGLFGTKRVG